MHGLCQNYNLDVLKRFDDHVESLATFVSIRMIWLIQSEQGKLDPPYRVLSENLSMRNKVEAVVRASSRDVEQTMKELTHGSGKQFEETAGTS